LTEPRNALIKQYTTIFERYGSELRFTDKGLRAVANEGLKRGGGARGLRGVLEEILGDAMFEVPESVSLPRIMREEDAHALVVGEVLLDYGSGGPRT
jgi:ATP-dependent protease Clp ATPase subunit